MKILLTGSSGFIGSSLVAFLKERGHQVIKLVRKSERLNSDERFWDPAKGIIQIEDLQDVDAVINLAGDNISNGRWTEEKKKRIFDSRIKSTKLLCEALSILDQPPKVLISASAIGFYGDRGDLVLMEDSLKGTGFLADVCENWEKATDNAIHKRIRVVNLRLGVVMSPKGGALKTMLFPFKWGLGGKLGSGAQYLSWVALEDVLAIINFVLENEIIKGPVNAVSPYPLTNAEFTKHLGSIIHRPTLFSVPTIALRMLLGQMADEMLLVSSRVVPQKLVESGYVFKYPTIDSYLKVALKEAV